MTGQMLGDYEIFGKIGEGGYAIVYKARGKDGKIVALKKLKDLKKDSKNITRFKREARFSQSLIHPNIVRVFDYRAEGDIFYIVMEYLEGDTLEDRLNKRGRPFSPTEAQPIIDKVTAALQCIHDKKYIHRDVKPGNIFITKDEDIKLLDMGIARETGIAPTETHGVGTPPYMAPEQYRNSSGQLDHRVDIYCFGAVIFKMLTGQDYLVNEDKLSRLNIQLSPLDIVMEKALAEKPEDRYSSVVELAEDIARYWSAPMRAVQLKALCLGYPFSQDEFKDTPGMQLIQAKEDEVLKIIENDDDIDLLILDADSLTDISAIIDRVKDKNEKLPIVTVSQKLDKEALLYMQQGAKWHIQKEEIHQKVDALEKIVRDSLFTFRDWQAIYAKTEKSKPYLDPGLDAALLSKMEPEEKYILKKLFPHSQEIHIFRVETGLSRSQVYRIKSDDEPTRIVKIEALDNISRVKEKFERLITPRLDRYIGQIENRISKGQLLGGASYMLAGSSQERDATTLTSFLLDRSKLREESIKDALGGLQKLLEQLYVGNVEHQVRFWAPYYSRALPCLFEVDNAEFLPKGTGEVGFILKSEEFANPVDAYDNPVLTKIKKQLRTTSTSFPITIKNFEVVEIDPIEGVIQVQDSIIFNQPLPTPRFSPSKDHPLLRIKIHIDSSNKKLLLDPLIRKGKRISVKGVVRPETFQENLLLSKIKEILPSLYERSKDDDGGGDWENVVELFKARFVDPIRCINLLLWEIGREDVIWPLVLSCPVIHGDLNTNNILVESNGETHVWLIDFTESTYGHIYYDLAKLEVEIRTHVIYRIFQVMCTSGKWTEATAIKVALLLENSLFEKPETLSEFAESIAEYGTFFSSSKQPVEWHNQVLKEYHLYWKKILDALAQLRLIASKLGRPEQFATHYPVALFFHSIAALKFKNLEYEDTFPWAKRLALICALVSGTEALKATSSKTGTSSAIRKIVEHIKEPSSFGIIRRKKGNQTQFLMQNVPSWNGLNLIGGKMKFLKDRSDFSITLQRELEEELNLNIKDYKITKEYDVVRFPQFSERDAVHKEYEFHLFEVALSQEASNSIKIQEESETGLNPRWNYWASLNEINNLKTVKGIEISWTTKRILQELNILQK
jgi:serine/threonine protein kinase